MPTLPLCCLILPLSGPSRCMPSTLGRPGAPLGDALVASPACLWRGGDQSELSVDQSCPLDERPKLSSGRLPSPRHQPAVRACVEALGVDVRERFPDPRGYHFSGFDLLGADID